MKNIKLRKFLIIILMIILFLSSFSSFTTIVNASMPMDEAYLYKVADCPTKLDYYSKKQGRWIEVICYLTEYTLNGTSYPAYCLIADNDRCRRSRCIFCRPY